MENISLPVVAITGGEYVLGDDYKSPFRLVREKYFQLLEKHNMVGVLINNTLSQRVLDTYAKQCDALFLTGGGDIHPKYYQTKKDDLTGAYEMIIDENRDFTELYLIKKFFELKKPILGVCRGNQLINVAFGGTLIQDIEKHFKIPKDRHLIPDEKGGWYVYAHKVCLDKKSKLFQYIKKDCIQVNSVHHQCIYDVPPGFRVVAKSHDDINEAIEFEGDQFVVGVQWHIEQLPKSHFTTKLIKEFKSAVLQRKKCKQ